MASQALNQFRDCEWLLPGPKSNLRSLRSRAEGCRSPGNNLMTCPWTRIKTVSSFITMPVNCVNYNYPSIYFPLLGVMLQRQQAEHEPRRPYSLQYFRLLQGEFLDIPRSERINNLPSKLWLRGSSQFDLPGKPLKGGVQEASKSNV